MFDHTIAFRKKMNSIGLKAREYSSCTYVDGSLVVFAGLSYAKMNEISIFDFKTWKWESIKFEKEEFVPETRFGHSAVSYNSKIFI